MSTKSTYNILKNLDMKQNQVDRKAMVSLVESTLVNAPEEVKDEIVGIVAKTEDLTRNLESISANEVIQAMDRKGYALEKKTRREVMEELTMFICRKATSLASDTGNSVLLEAVEVAPLELSRLTYEQCIAKSRSIHNVSYPYLLALAPYGVVGADFSNQFASTDSLETYMTTPRASVEERKIATEAIGTLLGDCDVVLKSTDRSVNGILTTQPAFHQLYFNCRQINDTGGRTIALRGHIEGVDGLPLSKVKVVIEGTTIVKKTTDKGNFLVKHLNGGMYVVKCSLNGYEEFKTTVAINDDKRTEFRVVMELVEVAV